MWYKWSAIQNIHTAGFNSSCTHKYILKNQETPVEKNITRRKMHGKNEYLVLYTHNTGSSIWIEPILDYCGFISLIMSEWVFMRLLFISDYKHPKNESTCSIVKKKPQYLSRLIHYYGQSILITLYFIGIPDFQNFSLLSCWNT